MVQPDQFLVPQNRRAERAGPHPPFGHLLPRKEAREKGKDRAPPEPARRMPLLALNLPIALVPLGIGHALALLLALRRRRTPEPDLVEVAVAVELATGIGQECVAGAGGGN